MHELYLLFPRGLPLYGLPGVLVDLCEELSLGALLFVAIIITFVLSVSVARLGIFPSVISTSASAVAKILLPWLFLNEWPSRTSHPSQNSLFLAMGNSVLHELHILCIKKKLGAKYFVFGHAEGSERSQSSGLYNVRM